MPRMLLSLSLAALLSVSAASVASAGPPWISIELPANPLNATSRGAFLLVRSYHHGDAMQYPIEGTAIGMVNGERRTLALKFDRTNIPGVLALRRSWPTEGTWVLAINAGGDEGPTALVGIGADGDVRSVNVPTQTRDGHTFGRKVTAGDIDATLRAVAMEPGDRGGLGAAGAILLVPVAAGILFARRRQR